jgi:ABC-type spermidine/putrescine transport system permease subunit I
MTTNAHAAGRDWKVTTGYRVMLRVAWGVLTLSVYGAVVAVVVGVPGAWWMAAGLAALAMLVAALLPEPVPADLITEARSHLDSHQAR